MKNYDIIGDIHGHADKLWQLLYQLGYKKLNGIYQHPDSLAVFLGDFIDRGPQQRQVIETVRPMVENGHALAVMGNHEYNAICYHTPDPGSKREFLRSHSEKNTTQHQKFLDEFPLEHLETQSVINWFRSLPVYLELDASASQVVAQDEPVTNSDSIRIIHACWDQQIIDWLSPQLTAEKQFTDEVLQASAKPGNQTFSAIETLLKGPEIPLPAGTSFKDKDGIVRYHIRFKWWGREFTTYREAALVPNEARFAVPDSKLPDIYCTKDYSSDEPAVFFGHYWMTGKPASLASNVACVDFSAAKQGPLVAYRWLNENQCSTKTVIKDEQFISVF